MCRRWNTRWGDTALARSGKPASHWHGRRLDPIVRNGGAMRPPAPRNCMQSVIHASGDSAHSDDALAERRAIS